MLLKNKLNEIKSLLKKDNVLTNLEEHYCYATDASNIENEGQGPDLVVFVETIEDVQKVLKYANLHEIPIIPRGAGTNMVGACVCNKGGIVLNFSKMNKIIDLNTVNMTATVQPGVIMGDLKKIAAQAGLFFPPDPSNFKVSTVGGAIAQSSAGAMSFRYGTMKDYVLSVKMVTSNGELVKFGADTIKDATGFHLAQLMVGSEGTLGIVVEAVLKLIPKPEATNTLVAYFSEIEGCVSAVTALLNNGLAPSTIDFMDKNSTTTVEEYLNVGMKTNHNYMLLIQFEGSKIALDVDISKATKILNSLVDECDIYDEANAEKIWQARRSSFAATTRLAPDVISDDIIVPRDKIAEMVKFCNLVCDKYDLKLCMVGHIGDGNLHPQIALNLENEEEFRNFNQAKSEIYHKAFELGGRISGEHGIGLAKLPYLENTMDKGTLDYMKAIKQIFDPKNILNPGKIFKIENKE